MFRQRCKFQKRFGLLQVIIACFVFIFTSVVISSNPASALVCDRTTNDYAGWRKKEWMDSWFNKQMYIPDSKLSRVKNSESWQYVYNNVASNGVETTVTFRLLPDGKMVATLKQRSFTSIQRYQCDKTALQIAEERTADLQEANKLAREQSRQKSENKKLAQKHKVDDGRIVPLETLWPHEIECRLDAGSGLPNRLFFKKDSVNLGVDAGLVGLIVPVQTTLTYDKWQALLDERGKAVLIVEYSNSNVKKANYKCNKTSFEVIKLASQYPVLTEAEIAERERKEKEKAEAEAKQLAEAEAKRLAEKKKKEEEAKKAAELAAKKKEEEAKKVAELAAKKKELEAKIASQKERLPDLYEDVIAYVKTSIEVDVIEWTNLYSNAPREEGKWTEKESNAFDDFEVKVFADNNFKKFHDESMAKRKQEFIQSVIDTRNSLSSVLSELETAARLNFGTPTGDKAAKIVSAIKSEIDASSTLQKNTLAKLADVQKEAEALASELREQAAKVFNLKKDIENYSQVLNEFVKNNFGTPASLEAGKLLAELQEQSTAGASELENLRKKLSTFIENNLEIQQALARQTSSNVATNKASANTKSAPSSAKNEKPVELSEEQKFINSLAEFKSCETLDFQKLATQHATETELQNDATEEKLLDKCVKICGYISEVDKRSGEDYGYAEYMVQIVDEKTTWQSDLAATAICYAKSSSSRGRIESAGVGDQRCLSGIVRSYGDMTGLQLRKCKVY